MGDGCFLYNPVTQSFGVSAAENIPIMIVVFNNGKYAAMQSSHLQFFPDGVAARTGIHHGVDIPGPNYAELVAPFGGHGERVEDPEELQPALGTRPDRRQPRATRLGGRGFVTVGPPDQLFRGNADAPGIYKAGGFFMLARTPTPAPPPPRNRIGDLP